MDAGNSWRSCTLAALVGVIGCGDGGGEAARSDVAIDAEALRAEVLALEDEMNLAVDALDCDGGLAATGVAADPLFVANGNVVRTKADLAAMCEQMVAPRTGAVFTPDSRTAHLISDDGAVVVREGTYEIDFRDGTSAEMYLVMTSVWTRGDDGWKMVHLHESSRPLAED
ncbi:MAG: nuclear transport factor 2 family protein [Gemmatimonadota bacterium]|nr:nuclear transport factor 2 family protein [Gemmatimonadota bacterium]